MSTVKLSVVLATRNEKHNIGECLMSVKELFADLPAQTGEIVVVDEESTDKTAEIAKSYGAKVYRVKHESIFHKNKQKAMELAAGDWILQLDADERVTDELAKEVKEVINLDNEQLKDLKTERLKNKLFRRHQRLIEERDGRIGRATGEIVAFFIPRRNYFLGKPLIHAGVYPDGVIRLVKKGKGHFPSKSVHELMQIDGEVAWLLNDLEHHDSPTFGRYLERMNRYTDLAADEFKKNNISTNYPTLFYYSLIKPKLVFLNLFIRHKGFMDGMRGFVWSLFSALHFPLAYFKYWQSEKV